MNLKMWLVIIVILLVFWYGFGPGKENRETDTAKARAIGADALQAASSGLTWVAGQLETTPEPEPVINETVGD